MTNSALFLVVLLTAIFMVIVAIFIAWLLPPQTVNFVKGEPYECGIPTRGSSWSRIKVGYYLFAILYLMFDVETVLLFPWASVMKDLGIDGLVCMIFFFIILMLGLVYAWKKGALQWK